MITGLQCGGAETVLARLVLETCSEFDHIVVVLRDEAYFGPVLRARGIAVHALDIGHRRGMFGGMSALVRIIRRERPEIVHTWMYHADLLGGLAARLAGVPSVVWGIRNTNLDVAAIGRSARFAAWACARLSSRVPHIITCNSYEAECVHTAFGYRAARFRIIPNGCDIERFRPDPAVREATRAVFAVAPCEVLIGMVARWDTQKDHANLLNAMGRVAKQRQDVRLLLAGAGMDWANAQLVEGVRAAGLDGRVILAGQRDDVPAIMNALDLHVLSSLGEAFPNVVAEAMSCGTPCVVTDVGDAARIVGDTGWIVRPRDSLALATAIEIALVALEKYGRQALGNRCRTLIVENFVMTRMTEAYAGLWRELRNQG